MHSHSNNGPVSIANLLKRLATQESARNVSAEEIAGAVSLVFTDSLSSVQFGVLLWALHTTSLDHQADVLAACATSMRGAAAQVDGVNLRAVIEKRKRPEGSYAGYLCDIVGTGGDGHNTFNVSTTSSIIASGLLMMAKHGNNSSTSLSGSADLLQNAKPKPPVIAATRPETLAQIYDKTNYAFLYAREWHPGMKYGASVRREVPVRTIFNLLGPLANPVHDSRLVECRILGVARKDVGQNFADALCLSGSRKALVVCGDENLDEISCAGPTHCWHIHDSHGDHGDNARPANITKFTISPVDFGFPPHPLEEVHGGKLPSENADILMQILQNQRPDDDPVLRFVLINTAALLAVSGLCDADESNMGHGDDGRVVVERGPGGLRWKEGVRRAKWCIQSGEALRQWKAFVDVTNSIST